MSDMYIIMDVLVIGVGAYLFYAFYLLTTKGEVKENILLPRNVEMKRCKDPEGYKTFLKPRLFVFSLVVTLCGLITLAMDYFQIGGYSYIILSAALLAVIIAFGIIMKKAVARFWN